MERPDYYNLHLSYPDYYDIPESSERRGLKRMIQLNEQIAEKSSTGSILETPNAENVFSNDSNADHLPSNSIKETDINNLQDVPCKKPKKCEVFSRGTSTHDLIVNPWEEVFLEDDEAENAENDHKCGDGSKKLAEKKTEADFKGISSEYFTKYNLQEPLTRGSTISKLDALIMILNMHIRYGMVQDFITDQIRYTNFILEDDGALSESSYVFNRIFANTDLIRYHYYCASCFTYIEEGTKSDLHRFECSTCNEITRAKFFVTISIRAQIKEILERNSSDGLLSEDQEENIGNMKISLLTNTDGVPVFKSSQNSLWPIQCEINELPPDMRFKFENRILNGLWFDDRSPPMDLFFLPFVQELHDLKEHGFTWRRGEREITTKVFCKFACADSTAKPKLLEMNQFNGYYGCPYCFHPGELIDGTNQIRYTIMDEEPPLRTDEEVRKIMEQCIESDDNVPIKGIKGKSIFAFIFCFNLVEGMVIDYMHCVLLGVVKTTVKLWCDSTSKGKPYYIGNKIKEIDKRLSTIKLPRSIPRSITSITERDHWKANQWRTFLFYCAIPVLKDILPAKYLKHFLLLVNAVYFFCGENISDANLNLGEKKLMQFVRDYEKLYGKINMKFNLHLLGHLGRSVRFCGPLWAFSAFPFESGNREILKFVLGTRGVMAQIASKFIMTKHIVKLIAENLIHERVLEFINPLLHFRRVKQFKEIDGIVLLGDPEEYQPTPDENKILCSFFESSSKIKGFATGSVKFWRSHSFIKDGIKYFDKFSDMRSEKCCDRLALLKNNQIVEIIKIIFTCNAVLVIGNHVNKVEFGKLLPEHMKKCFLTEKKIIVSAKEIIEKAILVECNGELFVTGFPNRYECD